MTEEYLIENYNRVLDRIRAASTGKHSVQLLAVSKKQPSATIQKLIDRFPGILIGENYVQEFEAKVRDLQGDYHPHLIGPLQSNKIKKAVALFEVIQSVSSLRTAQLINQEAEKISKKQKIYLQINISNDSQKSGFTAEDLRRDLPQINLLPSLEIQGIMTITAFYENPEHARPDFKNLVALAQETSFPLGYYGVSMGMSADYEVAIAEGATIVRIGTEIFGQRKK